MLSGAELGAAIREAMRLKGVTQAVVAREFGVTQPSVSDWLKYGRIDKAHISHLVAYFSDVVGADFWGLSADNSGPTGQGVSRESAPEWPFERITPQQWAQLTARQQGAIEDAAVQKLRELSAPIEAPVFSRPAAPSRKRTGTGG